MSSNTLAFQTFDRAARHGDLLDIVFLGGSLTWGANSTDPQLYSYRAQLRSRFQNRYPHAALRYWDAAIGGQGSQLGLFRLDRDVLSRKPRLLFLEYAVNDGPSETDEERLGSFEAIVRRVIEEAACPVIISLLAVREDITDPEKPRPRHVAHQAIAEAYGCGFASTVPWIREQVKTGRARIEDLWANPLWPSPDDVTHPGNLGYEFYSEAIWKTFEDAVTANCVCRSPDKMLHAETYMKSSRNSLAALSVPSGWKRGFPNRISVAYDFLMSRWLDDLLIAHRAEGDSVPSSLTLQFQGATVLLFGEATPSSGKFRVLIDGQPTLGDGLNKLEEPGVFNASSGFSGNGPFAKVVGLGFDRAQEHTLTIEPLLEPGQELRLESLCVAGLTG